MKRIGKNKSNLGVVGEDITKKYLINKGFNIVTQNFKTYHGEIDIVAKKNNETYFIEVKSIDISHGTVPTIDPRDNFTFSKSRKFEKAIEYYLILHPEVFKFKTLLICLYVDTVRKTAKIRYIENPVVL